MRFDQLKRREFITLVGSAVAAWPLVARAQQLTTPVVSFLHAGSPDQVALAAFRDGLRQAGYVEGRNVAIEFSWAENNNARLPELAADLVRRQVAVIVTPGSTPAALAAKAATTTIPIVFYVGADPVQIGLVTSFNRPGANATGISSMASEVAIKRLDLLRELLPKAARFALLVNPANQSSELVTADARTAAAARGWQIEIASASNSHEIDVAFAMLTHKGADALMVGPDTLVNTRRVQLVVLAAYHRLPTIYPWREPVEVGGLISYGANIRDLYRQTGGYVGRVLKGDKPADLPVLQPTQFDLVINLQTAKTLGLTVPATLLARADEVIE
jgi:putative tryptophan/tyrosine transport system substrate-binding protein